MLQKRFAVRIILAALVAVLLSVSIGMAGPQTAEPPTEEEIAITSQTAPITAILETEKGPISVELASDRAPLTVANFVKLAKTKYYDGLVFHRVEDWVIQGGCPQGTGRGGPGYSIKLETHPELKNTRGAIAMARSAHPDSAGSQFYILKTDAPWLDGGYAVFGYVTSGMDVVDAIQPNTTIHAITIANEENEEATE